MAAPRKDPEDRQSVEVRLRMTPHQARVLDAMRGKDPRTVFVLAVLRAEYARRMKYGGMDRVE